MDAIPGGFENVQERAPLDVGWQDASPPRRAGDAIPRLADRRSLPLSFAQEKLWLLDHLEPGNPAYNHPLALRLHGSLDDSALRRSMQAIIDRHEVLRTRIVTREGQPKQIISPSLTLDLPVIDLTESAATDREARARNIATEEALRPFDLGRGPILRATLLRLGRQDHVLLLIFHRIAFDEWSARVWLNEFAAHYRAFTGENPPAHTNLPVQYGDFAHWQRQHLDGERLGSQLDYWKDQLSGCIPLELPTDRPRTSVKGYEGARTEVILPAALTDAVRALGRDENATLFMSLLAAFQALLARYAGSEDIAVASMAAGRNRAETEELIGLFLNPLVLRTRWSGNPTFRELLRRVRETCNGAYQHQDVPFAQILDIPLREHERSAASFFEVVFNFENLPGENTGIPGLRVEPFEFETPATLYDLTLEIIPRGRELKCSFIYRTDLFYRGTVERLAGHYRTLLESIVAAPDRNLASLDLLTPAERHQLLVEWNRTEVEYPRDATLQELFEAQAERRPEAVALTLAGQHLTYGELNRQANRLAHQFRSRGIGLGTPVGLCVERSLETVVGMLAILKAGGACVPLDPAYPKDRLAFMVADAGIQVLLTHERLRDALPHANLRVAYLDRLEDSRPAVDEENPQCGVKSDNVAYLLYTSGSTGTPKGVEVLHRGIVRLLCGSDYIHFGPDEVFLQLSSISFDASAFEIWGALLHGGRCVLFPDRIPEVQQLRAVLKDENVTTLWLTPSLFNTLIDADSYLLSPVSQLLVGGEALSVPHIHRALALLPDTKLVNGYGPTESAVFACCYRIPRTQSPTASSIPIGRPLANTQVYILDKHLQPVPIGVAGELYIGGNGLARGYWNRPEVTRERFIPHPFSSETGARLYKSGDLCRYLPDGNIEYLGRLDNQVKMRGFRIELGEIESALADHPEVSAVAVVAREDIPGDKRLVAYVVPHHPARPPASKALRDYLREKLPDYMVPSDIMTLEALPLTPNGKVDRRALPVGSRARPAETCYIPPRSVDELQLVRIWEEVLNVRPIGIEHDFFELGGHSILAVRMMGRIEDVYGKSLPLATLFAQATIKHLVDCLRTECLSEVRSAIVPVQSGGSDPPFFFLHGDWSGGLYCRKLARLVGPDQPFYGVMPNGFDDQPSLPTVEAMAEERVRHLLTLQPQGPYLLGGFCNGGLVAYEMARQMERQGLEVGPVILIDVEVPQHIGWLKALCRFGGWLTGLDVAAQTHVYGWLLGYVRAVASAFREDARALLNLILQKIRRKSSRVPGTPPEEPGMPEPAFDDRERRLRWLRFRRIVMAYRPGPYQGRTVLLLTKDAQSGSPADPTAGWSKLTAQIEVYEVPGDHTTCLTEHVGVVAEHIRRCLHAQSIEAQSISAEFSRP